MFFTFFMIISSLLYAFLTNKNKNFKYLANKTIHFDCANYQELSNITCIPTNELKPFKYICNAIRRMFRYDRPKMSSFIKFKMNQFRKHVIDEESLANIDFLEKSLLCAVIYRRQYTQFNSYQQNHSIQYEKELPEIKKKYKFKHFTEEIFYFHNGLRFQTDKIKKYIKERDILDIGSFNGDSCTVLKDYTDRKVYSYDISLKNIKSYLKTMKKNNIHKDKYEIMHLGLSDKIGLISISSCGNAGCSILSGGHEVVNLTTIDNEVKKRNLNVGFIKADVEGIGLDVVKGGIETIKKQKPVLEFAVYHGFDELFGIFDLLKDDIGGYIFQIHSENMVIQSAGEIALFAYPSELMN